MAEERVSKNFIEEEIEKDLASGRYNTVHTRFPPEPNGYLHIGHTKAICIDFEMAGQYGGQCNLRFDDTNPEKEDLEYAEAIKEDIKWLGFDWEDRLFYGSDYSQKLYEYALVLIDKGLAYVDDSTPEEMRELRGTLTEPGKNSIYRDRSIEENRMLFEGMKADKYADGKRILRAKIDMSSPNMNMRDPAIYRIRHTEHYRTGNDWCIYPMYDYAHPIQDALEGITHSLCDLGYEDHRPLYDWVINNLDFEHKPRQIEFARLNITDTMLSKRYLKKMVEDGIVNGWDDPRMPTLCGMRRRGFSAEAIRDFIKRAGVAKVDSVVDYRLLEHCVREDLKPKKPLKMVVLDPLKVVITNYPEDKVEYLTAKNNMAVDMGCREMPISREIYIEREDFMEIPPKKFFRMYPGKEVRLKDAYIITCTGFKKDDDGNITEVHCTYDPETRSGLPGANRKIKGTLHWVSIPHAEKIKVRLFESLYITDAESGELVLNPDSFEEREVYAEPSINECTPGCVLQFLRQGYFCCDEDSDGGELVFNRAVSLKTSYRPPKN